MTDAFKDFTLKADGHRVVNLILWYLIVDHTGTKNGVMDSEPGGDKSSSLVLNTAEGDVQISGMPIVHSVICECLLMLAEKTDFERLTDDVFVYGSVALAVAMGQETGVLDTLCHAQHPMTSQDVAQACRLKERYVRELLNALVTGGLVELKAGTGGADGLDPLYIVPHVKRRALLKAGLACRAISAVARQFHAVKQCFLLDGPSCIRYGAEHFAMLDEMAAERVDNMVQAVLRTPGLPQLLEKGIEAAEVGCGSGRLMCHLAAKFPNSRFTLTDVASEPLQRARNTAHRLSLHNVSFRLLDICQASDDWHDKFDWLVAENVIHDLPRPLQALRGISKALKPGGHFSLVDHFVSSFLAENRAVRHTAALYTLGMMSCLPESYQHEDSEALGPCWGEERAREMLHEAGFTVLGLTRSGTEHMETMAVCMCQKRGS